MGVKIGTQISLDVINSDKKELSEEICKMQDPYPDAVWYNFYPKAPIKDFVTYRLRVDRNTREIVGVLAIGQERYFAHDEVMRVVSDTVDMLRKEVTLSDFSIEKFFDSSGSACGYRFNRTNWFDCNRIGSIEVYDGTTCKNPFVRIIGLNKSSPVVLVEKI